MDNLEQNVINREFLTDNLKEEIVGPASSFQTAQELNNDTVVSEENKTFFYWKYGEVDEEVYIYNKPSKKYAAGIIFPLSQEVVKVEEEYSLEEKNIEDDVSEESTIDKQEEEGNNNNNSYIQSNFGITFAISDEAESFTINFSGGIYERKKMYPQIQKDKWWFRKTIKSQFVVDLYKRNEYTLLPFEPVILDLRDNKGEEISHIKLRLDVVVRRQKTLSGEIIKLVTTTVTNVSDGSYKDDDYAVFQSEIEVLNSNSFLPYPTASELEADISLDDKKFDMLYRNEKNYAFGQNCSVDWKVKNNIVSKIYSTFLPEHETYTMTPDITIMGKKIEISHADLAAVNNFEELSKILGPLISGYENWFEEEKGKKVNQYYEEVFQENMNEINECLIRMKNGLELLKNPQLLRVFKLTNLAMLMQMTNGKDKRKYTIDLEDSIAFNKDYENAFERLDYSTMDSLTHSIRTTIENSTSELPWKKYKWRGFQIAFLLLSIESTVNKKSFDREIVDLIWFPTGGGKTEAYLAVAAFSMIQRRITDPNDTGVDILMRYTLRLLTADQFQRSMRLICSLEYLRSHFPKMLGTNEYSIGLWVGSSTTPNNIKGATIQFNKAKKKGDKTEGFLVSNCPWCGAAMEPENSFYPGYSLTRNGLKLNCPDNKCHFHSNIPVYFVDEQLYKNPPTFLIGTIDKFVQLTWVPEARSLFGLDKKGNRMKSPPNIIIQDELHLISGPLGTLAGIYETLIEELSTDYREGAVKAKIIGATATIKAYSNQIKAIFGRSTSKLFPPNGTDINDNFYSTIQRDTHGRPVNGKKYVGVYTSTVGILQAQVQTLSSLLMSTNRLEDSFKDPFWTILSFYNSLRDIGIAISLTEQDIPKYMQNHAYLRNYENRYLNKSKLMELTSRISNSEVSKAIDTLKQPYSVEKNKALDLCLASNIIEVGIDIDRLSLMTIIGQPKTTAQYIQVSGRVGRKPNEKPGLVVTIYNPNKSIDKSHYEHFKEYHQKLYGQVEESSVTPFSRFAIQRGLPAILIGFIRQFSELKTLGLQPVEEEIVKNGEAISRFMSNILKKMELVDNTEREFLLELAKELMTVLTTENIGYSGWKYNPYVKDAEYSGFMAPITNDQEYIPDNVWPIIFSMRSVDTDSKLQVTKSLLDSTIDGSESTDNSFFKGWG